ncbi:hypothetical protein BH18ACI1_BH18ACI1_22510 [soil metagenome]
MGQLIIEIPFDVNRCYQIKNTKLAADMLALGKIRRANNWKIWKI